MAVRPITVQRWRVNNFLVRSSITQVGEKWKGPSFPLEGLAGAEFQLAFVPLRSRKSHHEVESRSSLECLRLDGRSTVRVCFKLWMENEDGVKNQRIQRENEFLAGQSEWIDAPWMSIRQLLPSLSSTLFLCCEIECLEPIKETSGPPTSQKLQIADDIAATWEDKRFTDVEVHVGGQVFRCHKIVLASRSLYFAALFTHDEDVKRTGVTEQKAFGAEITGKVLKFLYTGEADDLKLHARQLLPAADFYQLPSLQKLCIAEILGSLSIETALDDLKLAHSRPHFEEFKAGVLMFAQQNAKAIYELPGFKDFLGENTDLAHALFGLFFS